MNQATALFAASEKDGVVTIAVHKDFDAGMLHQDWARQLIAQFSGTYQQVRIDMSLVGLVSSTFFAGLVQLNHHFNLGKRSPPIVLVKPDPRVVRNLKILHLHPFFTIEAR